MHRQLVRLVHSALQIKQPVLLRYKPLVQFLAAQSQDIYGEVGGESVVLSFKLPFVTLAL